MAGAKAQNDVAVPRALVSDEGHGSETVFSIVLLQNAQDNC